LEKDIKKLQNENLAVSIEIIKTNLEKTRSAIDGRNIDHMILIQTTKNIYTPQGIRINSDQKAN